MRKYLWIALGLFLIVGCSSRRGSDSVGMDPLQSSDEQPQTELQDVMAPGDLTETDLSGGSKTGDLHDVFFAYNEFEVAEDQLPVLESNARVVALRGLQQVRIEGHCDERGTEEYNLALGDRRARIAKEYLVAKGVSPDKIQTVSFGESRPFEAAHNEDAWSLNRRAHFVATD